MNIFKEPGVLLLKNLLAYDTINNPGEGKYPDQKIIPYIQKILSESIPDFQSKVFTKGKYSSLYLTNDLKKPCDLLFMGHLDVVPISQGWNSNPFELTIKDNKYGFGRGSKDCKGSVVSSILFLQSLLENTNENQYFNKVGLYLSTDEETGGDYGAKCFFDYTNENNLSPKYVINVDGGPRVVFKRRAGFRLALHAPPSVKKKFANLQSISFESRIIADNNRHSAYFVRGVDTHALLSLSKHLHINPHLTQVINLLRSLVLLNVPTELASEFGVTVNPNMLFYSSNEGTDINFDVRAFLSPENKEILVEALNNRLGSFSQVCQIRCLGSSGFFHTEKTNPLVSKSTQVMKDHLLMSQNEEPVEQEGASDARYASSYNIPVIDLG
ncbi:MAG: M20/M25/M40 family metallo-hydrolase, partial [Candidatus Hodarchaeales archaeon]